MRINLIGASVVALAELVSAARGTDVQQPEAAPVFHSNVDVVSLDVTVLDRERQPVRGLTAADFTIVAGGVGQPIVAFEEVRVPGAVAVSAPWMRDVASDVATNDVNVRRVVVLVLDDAHIPMDPLAIASTKRIAREVVEGLGPDDLAAVTFTWSGRKQDITSDRQRLLASIESFVPHPKAVLSPRIGPTRMDAGSRTPLNQPPVCSTRGRYRSVAACAIDMLVHTADALAAAPPGRKTLIYISNGMPFDFSAGSNQEWTDEMRAVDELFRRLQRGNVFVHTLDPVGLAAPSGYSAAPSPSEREQFQRLQSLQMLAENTGGRAVVNTNAPWEGVPQIFRENSAYYLIGFQPTHTSTDGRFRSIQVQVNRPDVEVRTRSGYYGPAPESRADANGPESIADSPDERALSGPLPGGSLTLRASAVPVYMPGRSDPTIVVTVGLREHSAGRAESRTVNVSIIAFDDDWEPRATAESSATLSFPASTGRELPYDLVSAMLLRPGRYQLRVGAEVDGEVGSVFVDVDVPDFARAPLALSGLVMAVDPPIPTAAGPDVAGLLPVMPTTQREFRVTQRVSALLRVVQGRSRTPVPVRLRTTIVDAADRTAVDTTSEIPGAAFPSATRSVDFTYVLPTATLTPGEYLLTFDASQGSTTVRRTTRFTLR